MIDNPTDKRHGRIADYAALIQATDGLTLSQICALSALEPSTIQNWIKRGFVPHPIRKKYFERHLARILLIAELRESMQIDRVGELLRYVNGDTDDESDDIITEENLYDLFLTITEKLEAQLPAPDQVEELVDCVMDEASEMQEHREKISRALCVMSCTYMANIYKREADSLFHV